VFEADFRQNWFSPKSEFGQKVSHHIVVPLHIIDFVSEKALGHFVKFVPLCRHSGIPSIPGSGYLLGDQVGIAITYDVLDANLLGDAKTMK
jgi:hypothetical protein